MESWCAVYSRSSVTPSTAYPPPLNTLPVWCAPSSVCCAGPLYICRFDTILRLFPVYINHSTTSKLFFLSLYHHHRWSTSDPLQSTGAPTPHPTLPPSPLVVPLLARSTSHCVETRRSTHHPYPHPHPPHPHPPVLIYTIFGGSIDPPPPPLLTRMLKAMKLLFCTPSSFCRKYTEKTDETTQKAQK